MARSYVTYIAPIVLLAIMALIPSFMGIGSAVYEAPPGPTVSMTSVRDSQFEGRPPDVLSHAEGLPGTLLQRRANGVTFMVPCTEKDLDILSWRIKHMMDYQRYEFQERVFVVDTRGKPLSEELVAVLESIIQSGLMDSWAMVNYSRAYVDSVKKRAGWKTELTTMGRIGNLVYFFMLDKCQTKYLCHFDLDIVMWSRPDFSWVEIAIRILQDNPQALTVVPPRPHMEENSSWTDRFTCGGPFFISARYYTIDKTRYDGLLDDSHIRQSFPNCFGDVHWEKLTSCLACSARLKKINMLESHRAWVLHFPSPRNQSDDMRMVLDRLVSKGIAITESKQKPYNAAKLSLWVNAMAHQDNRSA